nr:hypothetical protein [Tanacetum cinerariifolium]
MFRISPDKVSREAKKVPNTVRLDNTKTRRPQPRSNKKNDRVPSASKSSQSKNKEVKVEEHHRNLLLSKKNKLSSSSRGRKHKAHVSKNETQMKYQPKVTQPKNVGTRKSLATPKPRKPRFLLRWSPLEKCLTKMENLLFPVTPRVMLTALMVIMHV